MDFIKLFIHILRDIYIIYCKNKNVNIINTFYKNEGPSVLLLTCPMNFITTIIKSTATEIPSDLGPLS